jgi:predicted amidophosphoribosyltransferase
MVFYCPNCWKELPGAREICPNCAQRISSWDEKAFTEKLMQALSHPEPETPVRAVHILGEKKRRKRSAR